MPEATGRGWDPRLVACTWFGAGHLHPAPGTWGSLAAGLCAWVMLLNLPATFARPSLLAAAALATLVGIWAAPAAVRHFGVEDPPQVVIDEVAGTWLAISCLPAHALAQPLLAVAVAVALFRVFDIAKPWPVGWCEHLPRGWGIMADDLAAGAIAGGLGAAILA